MQSKILIVDEEDILLKGLRYRLEQEGYLVDTADDGNLAFDLIQNNKYDAIILETELPGLSGMELCRKVRDNSNIPIIFLSSKDDDSSKVLGLEYGADDYITKPFNMLELQARIKSILRRSKMPESKNASNIIQIGNFTINILGRKVTVNNKNISLTAKEFDLLLLLVLNEDRVFSREELLETIWGYEYYGDVRTVDVHVRRLREKIETESSAPEYIQTKWGVGYYYRNFNK